VRTAVQPSGAGSAPPGATTRIARDWSRTLRWSGYTAVNVALASPFFLARGFGFKLIGGLVLLPALYLGWRAKYACSVGRCPGCGHELEGLDGEEVKGVPCPLCFRYVEGEAGVLRLTPEDRITDRPLFRTPMPRRIRWPDGCSVCGGLVTRGLTATRVTTDEAPIASDLAVRAATLGTFKLVTEVTHSLVVPHCDEHSFGVVLHGPGLDEEGEHVLAFRSLRFQTAFRALNGTRPL